MDDIHFLTAPHFRYELRAEKFPAVNLERAREVCIASQGEVKRILKYIKIQVVMVGKGKIKRNTMQIFLSRFNASE